MKSMLGFFGNILSKYTKISFCSATFTSVMHISPEGIDRVCSIVSEVRIFPDLLNFPFMKIYFQ